MALVSRRWQVFELRQYTLVPGTRDAFVALFDGTLVRPHDAVGMRAVGQFRDLDRPDMFVWLRAFPDMEARSQSLHAFYDGPVWAAHREAANGMMLDSDDVLLLEPRGPEASLDDLVDHGGAAAAPGQFVIQVDPIDPTATDQIVDDHVHTTATALRAAGGEPFTPLASLHTENTFPRLPVRAGENVIVTVARFPETAPSGADFSAAGIETASAQTLRLAPTGRSAMR